MNCQPQNINKPNQKMKFTCVGKWIRHHHFCPVCPDYKRKKMRQLSIKKYLHTQNIKLEHYDADVEMEEENKPIRKKINSSISKKNTFDMEMLSILLEGLDTQKKPRYNLRKRKKKTEVSKTPKREVCGKRKKKTKKSKVKDVQHDFSILFENMRL